MRQSTLRVSGEDVAAVNATVTLVSFFDLPFLDLSLTEILLCVLCVLLYRIGNVLAEGLRLLRDVKSTDYYPEKSQKSLTRTQTRISYHTKPQPAAKLQPAPAMERPLRESAQLFSTSLLDATDVDTCQFVRACRHFESGVLVRLGAFTMMGARSCSQTTPCMHGFIPHARIHSATLRRCARCPACVSLQVHAS